MSKLLTLPTLLTLASVSLANASTATIAKGKSNAIDGLKPHRAVYDLALRKASDRSGITGMNGRIVYEVTGSHCEGFSVKFRFFTTVQTPRKSFTNDQRTSSFESADGKTLSFIQQSYLNGQLEFDLRGKAERKPAATLVELTKPDAENVKLGPSVFVTEHMSMLIDAAQRQQTFVTANVYDGSDDGSEVMATTAVIGQKKQQAIDLKGEPKALSESFKGQIAWPVSVSYFSSGGGANIGEKLPVYQVSFIMHESGVSRQLKMQYADYSLKGDLKKIEYLPTDRCD